MTRRELDIYAVLKAGGVLFPPRTHMDHYWTLVHETTGNSEQVTDALVQRMKKKGLLAWIETPTGRLLRPTL